MNASDPAPAPELAEEMLVGVGDPVLVFDHHWNVLAANPEAGRRLGDARSMVLLVHPDDRDDLHQLCRQDGAATGTLRLVDRSGEPWTASVTVTAVGGPAGGAVGGTDDGVDREPRRWVAWARDLGSEVALHRALAAAERRARWLFNALPVGVAVVDRDDVVVQANPELLQLLLGSDADLVGRSLRALWVPDGAGTGTDGRLVAEGRATAGGTGRHLRVTVAEDRPGPDDLRLVMVEDIDAETVREGQEVARQRLAAIGRLAAGVAHEINTPMQYVGDNLSYAITAVEHLRQAWATGEPSPTVQAALEELPSALADALEGARRVSQLAGAMKVLGNPGGETPEQVDLVRLVGDAVTVCRGETRDVADVRVQAPGSLPVACRPTQVGEVVVNLLVNAAQAIAGMDRPDLGSILVTVTTDDDQVVLTVRDDGPGITPHVQARMFEPLFTTKKLGRGTGWGLARVHAIVTEHGGTVHCVSQPGHGATFTVRMPLEGLPT